MHIYLIRHGMTNGNKEKRYIGRTDEPLCDEGIEQVKEKYYPEVDSVYASPLVRCIETAQIIYPNISYVINNDLIEMNFGLFEGKNYEELKDNPEYISWLKSGGSIAFPEGESKEEFCDRCIKGFETCISRHSADDKIAFVVHGGTIMAIMEKYGTPAGEYYKWQIKNGEMICIEV